MMNFLMADALARVRNAIVSRHASVDLIKSRFVEGVVRILAAEGYITGYSVKDPRTLVVDLKYGDRGESAIAELKLISKPGRRVYVNKKRIPHVKNDLGIAIISSSSGLVTDRIARRDGIGGELVCTVF